MSDTQTGRLRPAGETSGSAQRPPQRLALPTLSFDLMCEVEQLRQEESYRGGDRNAKTLVKEHGLRVVLTVMRSGARLQEHKTAGAVSVQTLTGHIRLHVLQDTIDLPVGHVVMLDENISHDVEAAEESAFLLTIASGPPSADG
jgi:quercetin dioxygenase-like cupin family protein